MLILQWLEDLRTVAVGVAQVVLAAICLAVLTRWLVKRGGFFCGALLQRGVVGCVLSVALVVCCVIRGATKDASASPARRSAMEQLAAAEEGGSGELPATPSLGIESVAVDAEVGIVEIVAAISGYPAPLSTADVRVLASDSLSGADWQVVTPVNLGVSENTISAVVPASGEVRFYKFQVGEGLGLSGMGVALGDLGVDEVDAEHLDAARDEDCDGLSNGDERLLGTDPFSPDTDGDGLTDGVEVDESHTNPLLEDTDGDDIPDGDEFLAGGLPNTYSPVTVGAPAFQMDGAYSVSLWYDTPTTGGFSVYGITWPGGSATTTDLAFDVWGSAWDNAFTMCANGASFRALKNGRYAFQIDADDEATIGIGEVEVSATYPDATPSPEVACVLARGSNHPVSAVVSSIGGPAKLALLKWGDYSPVSNPLTVNRAWIGLDRRGCSADPYQSDRAVCSIARNPSLANAPVVWRYAGACNRREEGASELQLWTTSKERASASCLGEAVTAYVLDGISETVRFTIVKLDVSIDGLKERMEEEVGAFLGKGGGEAEVSFSCMPADLPDDEYVTISVSAGARLMEILPNGDRVEAASTYRANELNGRNFVLCGLEASCQVRDGLVTLSHAASGAEDRARFTVVEFDLSTADLNHTSVDPVLEMEEESPGALIHFNIDDDDGSGVWSGGYDKYPGADFRQESIAVDQDLVQIRGTLKPYGGEGVLEFKTSRVALYAGGSNGKDRAGAVCMNGFQRVYPLEDANNVARFGETFFLRAEGRSPGIGYVEASFRTPYGKAFAERLQYTVVAATCGDQPWCAPNDATLNYDASSLRDKAFATGAFPDLTGCEWSVVGDRSPFYNCLAWAVGRTDVCFEQILWERTGGRTNWITDSDGVVSVSIDGVFGNDNGVWELSDIDAFFLLEAQMIPTGSIDEAEIVYYEGFHAAKRRHCNCGEGRWSMFESKCGVYEVIEHLLPQLERTYGPVVRMYKPMANEED